MRHRPHSDIQSRISSARISLMATLMTCFLTAYSTGQTFLNPPCWLSTADNRTFTSSAIYFSVRQPDEAVRALSCGWAPSLRYESSTLVLGNDSSVPTFWMVATSTGSGDVLFLDSRFELCLVFSSSKGASMTSCAQGLDAPTGTFRFEGVVLPTGNWVFTPDHLIFNPQGVSVNVSATSSTFCCINVTQPFTATSNASLLQFSAERNDGILFPGKSLCAVTSANGLSEGGSTLLPPITVEIARVVSNMSSTSSYFTTSGPRGELCSTSIVPRQGSSVWSYVFQAQLIDANTQATLATWKRQVDPGYDAKATFTEIDPSAVLSTSTSSSTLQLKFTVLVNSTSGLQQLPLNALLLNLRTSRVIRNRCDLYVPHRRNSPLLTMYQGWWGFPVAVGLMFPARSLSVVVRSSDRSLASTLPSAGINPTIRMVVVDDNGQIRDELISTLAGTAAEASAAGDFRELRLANVSISTSNLSQRLFWLRFSVVTSDVAVDSSVLMTSSFPFYVVASNDVVKLRQTPWVATFEHKGGTLPLFRESGTVAGVLVNQSIPTIGVRVLNQAGTPLSSASSTGCKVSVEFRMCGLAASNAGAPLRPKWTSIPPTLRCLVSSQINSNIDAYGVKMTGASSNVLITSEGVAQFDNLRVTSLGNTSSPFVDLIASFTLSCPLSSSPWWGSTSLSWSTNILRVCSSKNAACVVPDFLQGIAMPSLFSDELQTATAIVGIPLPPIIIAMVQGTAAATCDSSGNPTSVTNDLVNPSTLCLYVAPTNDTEAWRVRVTSDAAIILQGESNLQNGFFQLPGITIASATASSTRLKFSVFQSRSSDEANFTLETGVIALLDADHAIELSAPSLKLQFANSFSLSTASLGTSPLPGGRFVALPNRTALPPFELQLLRSDNIFGRSATSELSLNMSATADWYSSIAASCTLALWFGAFSMPNNTTSIASVSTTVNVMNGTATVTFPASTNLYYGDNAMKLSCCVGTGNAVFRCAEDVYVHIVSSLQSALAVVASRTSSATDVARYDAGLSATSPYCELGPLSLQYGSTIQDDVAAYCWGNTSGYWTLALCSGNVSASNVSFLFPVGVAASDGAAPLTPDNRIYASALSSSLAEITIPRVADTGTTPADGVIFAAASVDTLMGVSRFTALEAPTPSLRSGGVLIYLSTPLSSVSLIKARSIAQTIRPLLSESLDPTRILIGGLRTATFVRPVDRSPIALTAIEATITPPWTTSSASVGSVSRVQSSVMSVKASCTQVTASRLPPTAAGLIITAFGTVPTSPHAVVVTNGDQSSPITQTFCDIALAESLAEGARHCEIMYGSDFRCACFVPLFEAQGQACVTESIVTHVCDHMAYCTSKSITNICSQIEPNIALEVFFVVGGTLLGLAVIVGVVKAKVIWRYLTEARHKMSNNAQYVRSRQSAASLSTF